MRKQISRSGGYLEKDSVVFRDRFGVPIKLNPQTNTLTFTAPQTADTNYIYAYDKTGERIGKLMVKTYAVKTYDVVLVSVNGAKLPDTDMLKKYLNETYNQVAVSWNIGIDTISIPELRHFSHGGSSWTGVYNDDQKLVLSSYDQKIRKDTYYLFFIDNANSSGVAGYMPLYHQCGFIYNFPNNRTIAHELGHGVFGLEHTFDSGVKGATDNLMDYNFGDILWHPQWDLVRNPKFKLLKWNQKEDDGESIFNDGFYYVSVSTNKNLRIFNDSYFNIYEGTQFVLSVETINERWKKRVEQRCANYGSTLVSIDSVVVYKKNIVWKDSNNQNIDADFMSLTKGVYSYSMNVDSVTVFLKYKKDNKQYKTNTIFSNYLDPISFTINVCKNPIVSFIPSDLDNFYQSFGFDDAQIVECQKNGDYSTCEINDEKYYIPWLTIQPKKNADLKMDINLAEELFLSPKLAAPFLIGQDNQSKVVIDTSLYFMVESNKDNNVPIKINGKDCLRIGLSDIENTIRVSSDNEGVGFVDVYTIMSGIKKLSGRLEVDCRRIKQIGDIQFVSVNNYPVGDVFARLDSINKYFVQAGVEFSLYSCNVMTKNLNVAPDSRNVLTTFKDDLKKSGYKDGPFYVFFNQYGYAGDNSGNSFPPQKDGKSSWIEVRIDDPVVLVHELIHTMGLKHTFDNFEDSELYWANTSLILKKRKYVIRQKSTNNIMDYTSNIKNERRLLMKYQINHIYNTFANFKLYQK